MGNLTSTFCPPNQERPYSAHGFSDPPGRSVRPSPLSDGVPHRSVTTVSVAFQHGSSQNTEPLDVPSSLPYESPIRIEFFNPVTCLPERHRQSALNATVPLTTGHQARSGGSDAPYKGGVESHSETYNTTTNKHSALYSAKTSKMKSPSFKEGFFDTPAPQLDPCGKTRYLSNKKKFKQASKPTETGLLSEKDIEIFAKKLQNLIKFFDDEARRIEAKGITQRSSPSRFPARNKSWALDS